MGMYIVFLTGSEAQKSSLSTEAKANKKASAMEALKLDGVLACNRGSSHLWNY